MKKIGLHLRRDQGGLSLVEIMIALALSLVLLMGVIDILTSNRQAFRIQTAMARIQESGRYAAQRLAYDLRMAGYLGCGNLKNGFFQANVLASPRPMPGMPSELAAKDMLKVYQADGESWTPALPAGPNPAPLAGTDVVEIHRAGDQSYSLANGMSSRTAPIHLTASSGLEKDDWAVIADCRRADVFRVTGIDNGHQASHAAGENTSGALSGAYGTGARVAKFLSTLYYVGDTGRVSENGAAIPALYRYTPTAGSEELLEGVEDMQVVLGVDEDGDGSVDRYLASTDADKAISVRLEFLMRSLEDHVTSEPRKYTYGGTIITPTDHHLRKVFTVQVQLRNLAGNQAP